MRRSVAGPLGAARLVPTDSLGVRVVAAVTYGWTAYLAERLLMGHWPYLLAYAALPWVVLAPGQQQSTARLVLACLPGILTPTGGILVSVTAMVAGGRQAAASHRADRRRAQRAVVGARPAALRRRTVHRGRCGRLRRAGENWGGPVLSLLGSGGIWNAEVTPASRANPLVPVVTLAIVAVALFGLRELDKTLGAAREIDYHARRRRGPARRAAHPARRATSCSVGSSPTCPVAGCFGTPRSGWPGGRFRSRSGVAPAVDRVNGKAVVVAAVVAAAGVMPDFAFAAWGRLHTADYPADWYAVRDILASDARPGDVVTQPFGSFRQFDWNRDRTQLDPAPRFLPRPTVIDDTLYVNGRPVAGEDPRARAIRGRRTAAPSSGIGWVLVEHGTPGQTNTPGSNRSTAGSGSTSTACRDQSPLRRMDHPARRSSWPSRPRGY